jgi:hypothetical protein
MGGKKPQGLKGLGSFGRGWWLSFKEDVTITVPSLSRNNLEVIEKMGDGTRGTRPSAHRTSYSPLGMWAKLSPAHDQKTRGPGSALAYQVISA